MQWLQSTYFLYGCYFGMHGHGSYGDLLACDGMIIVLLVK